MKYFLIAGEASGDLHGANVIKAIRQKDPEAQFQFWGGDHMSAAANGLLMHYKEVSIMGFIEVLLNIRKITANLSLCKSQIMSFQPDVVVMIDYPGFNLRIAEFCKKNGFKTAYFIAPKIWAWKENRGKKLERFVDELLLIFPFEVAYFKKWKVKSTYVGNPLADELKGYTFNTNFRKDNQLTELPIIALLPGSRKQEIKRMLPVMLDAVSSLKDHQIVVAGAPGIDSSYYTPYLSHQVSIVFNQTYNLLHHTEAAIVCSGTATLETALLHTPQICGYAAHPISYAIAKMLVDIKYISLVNLCMQKEVITELIQSDMNPERLKAELLDVIPGGIKHAQMMFDYQALQELVGKAGASERAATVICDLASRH